MSFAVYVLNDDLGTRDYVESCTDYHDAKRVAALLNDDIEHENAEEDYPSNFRVTIVEEK